MKLFLPQKNSFHLITQMYQNAMEGSLTLRDLTKFLVKLTSTIQAILPEKLQNRFLQQTQLRSSKNMTYESVATRDQQAKEEPP